VLPNYKQKTEASAETKESVLSLKCWSDRFAGPSQKRNSGSKQNESILGLLATRLPHWSICFTGFSHFA
jgi:hypothetical protein